MKHKVNKTKLTTCIFILATALFFLSMHMVDTGFNIDSTCIDRNVFGFEQSKTEMYQRGYTGLLISFFLFAIAFLLII